MADDSAGNFGVGSTALNSTVRPDLSDLYLYFYKLDTWEKNHVAKMLGLQGSTSGTNTKTVTTIQTKTVPIKTMGQPTQQRTVLAYFQVGDGIFEDMKKAWKYGITIHLYRVNLNQITGDKPARQAPCEYSQCLLGALPQTESLGGIMQASLALEVQGLAQESLLSEADLEEAAFDQGVDLYNFIKPTLAGGSDDQTYDNANAAKPTVEESDGGFMTGGADSGSGIDFGTGSGSSGASSSATSSTASGASSAAS
ncbi:hypothetical protein [Loigolactobacillus backii]|uniref:hypothetical protein n=1 Tax=Loigolactobacillus backii TaxID=375175 RepID=UPI0007F08726|nr:hypothetical protein [Loigolactobacillus backii]ANK59813.1 hypothetical protein AYR52_05790 [Loigolactobacillus backii]